MLFADFINSLRDRKRVFNICDAVIILLSAGLIAYISVDTFTGVQFLHDHMYMTFQFWVCVVFMAVFFVELYISHDKRRYVRRRWLYLVFSIPWLNIISYYHIGIPSDLTYFLRFIPLARGALAVAIVVGYLSKNRVTQVFASYVVILTAVIYFGSLIFFEQEQGINPRVPDYGAALWWAALNATTAGSPITPMSVAGKVTGCVLAVMGMIMFPLFTVYATDWVRRYLADRRQRRSTTLVE